MHHCHAKMEKGGKMDKIRWASLMKFQKMKYLDNKHNVGTEEEGHSDAYGMNLKEYQDELEGLANWNKKTQSKLLLNPYETTDKQK